MPRMCMKPANSTRFKALTSRARPVEVVLEPAELDVGPFQPYRSEPNRFRGGDIAAGRACRLNVP